MHTHRPALACDCTAVGGSGEAEDTCSAVVHRAMFAALEQAVGRRMFVFMDEHVDQTEIVGGEAIVEDDQGAWRARPDAATWYRGAVPGNTPL